ncbi:MAG: serine acetyltransferase [Candidatus Magasanikbacteria bacterium]
MNLSLSHSELKQYISGQLDNFFPDKYKFVGADIDRAFDTALQRTEYCFKHISLRYYNEQNNTCFYHLHADQYCSFLYFLANSLWLESQNKPLCDKLLLLNKTLNSIFISYKCKMPDIFLFSHAIGTIIGNAIYSNFLVVFQNVTVNTGDDDGTWKPPTIGKGVFLAAGSSIIGSGKIGDYSSIGINSVVFKADIPENSIVFTDSTGKLNIKDNQGACFTQKYFNVDIKDLKWT